MSFERNDMYYHDYTWTPREDETQVKAISTFQPDNGNAVLQMINSLTQNVLDSQILEIIIHEFIPNTVKTLTQAYDWIKQKGDQYYKAILRSIAKSDEQSLKSGVSSNNTEN